MPQNMKTNMKSGTFAKSARFHVPKNGTSDAETKKRDHFFLPTTPQNGVRHVCFMRLALLGGF